MNINELNINEMLKSSFKTLKEMLNDRNIDTTYLDKISEEEIIKLYEENQIFDFKVNDTLKIMYYMNTKIKINDIRKYISTVNDANTSIIFISKEKFTTNNYKSFNDFKDFNIIITFFHLKELLINIYNHNLVPKHIPITDKEEINKIMEMYSIKSKFQFPIILNTDPISKYLDIKSDTLVKIIRPSKTSGEYVLYRYCI
jgi:DNA-directed RNA polymerase I, II, and III subunit RPABC1|tara:strand:- start:61 stop:660 length:600 start_codon:yes stop_codon:yes gene_type:complete